jgi:hypothetical protein
MEKKNLYTYTLTPEQASALELAVAGLSSLQRVTVPYTTLKSAPPKKGSRWLLNIARTDYFSKKSEPELSLWSPNLENMTFHDPECFGTAVFK